MMQLDLNGVWRLYAVPHAAVRGWNDSPATEAALAAHGERPIPGAVPGSFEDDLMREGLLPDLYRGKNVLAAQRLENRHLYYVRTFSWDGGDAALRFDGIDTVAEIFLNGRKIGETDNMFIPHTLEADGLRRGENELLVHVLPAMIAARSRRVEPYATPALPYNYASLPLRKAAHMYGWDIFPRIVSGGLWRGVSIAETPAEEIEALYLYTQTADEKRARLALYYRVRVAGDFIQDYTLRVTGRAGAQSFTHEARLWHTEGTLVFDVAAPRRWWPLGMGEPTLYDVTATLLCGGACAASRETRLGIRTVRLERSEVIENDGAGQFCFYVNDEPVAVRGTNWVPLDALHGRDAARLPMATALLADSGCNMIRIWGGGVYESDALYDFCDAHGILVWQDFMMGCAAYPQTDALAASLREEAEAVIARLRQHPCLALWAGDNECDSAIAHWSAAGRDPGGNRLTRQVLPDAVRRLDPARPYLPSSPYLSPRAWAEKKSSPEDHLWGPRDEFKGPYYTGAKAVFASETGYHGCPNPSSLARFLSPEALFPWERNEEWLAHASCMEPHEGAQYAYRIPLMARQVKALFGEVPDDLAHFAAASQISQSEAMKFFLERFRGAKWRRTGIIWWNLLDGWPQFSDAVVDYYGGRKLAYYTLRASQNPVLVMLGEEAEGAHPILAVNDTREAVRLAYRIADADSGETVAEGEASLGANAPAAALGRVTASGQRCLAITWEAGGRSGRSHYLTGRAPYRLADAIRWMRALGYDLDGLE